MRQLFLDDVDFGYVFESAWPLPGPQAYDAAYDFCQALNHHHHASEWDDELELPDRRTICSYIRMLVNPPGLAEEDPTRIDQSQNPGNEKQNVQKQVEACLHARPHRAVKKIAAHMRVLRQR